MDDFSPPQQQSTLTQNDFSTKRGAANFKDTIDIENCAIISMHEHMLKSRAAVTRGSADKRNATDFDLLELAKDIPDEYVDVISSHSDPDFATPKHKKTNRIASSSLSKNSEPAISRKRSIPLVKQSKSYSSSKTKLSGINETLTANVQEYYSQVQQLKKKVRMQEKELEYPQSKLSYISELSDIGPIFMRNPMKDE